MFHALCSLYRFACTHHGKDEKLTLVMNSWGSLNRSQFTHSSHFEDEHCHYGCNGLRLHEMSLKLLLHVINATGLTSPHSNKENIGKQKVCMKFSFTSAMGFLSSQWFKFSGIKHLLPLFSTKHVTHKAFAKQTNKEMFCCLHISVKIFARVDFTDSY